MTAGSPALPHSSDATTAAEPEPDHLVSARRSAGVAYIRPLRVDAASPAEAAACFSFSVAFSEYR